MKHTSLLSSRHDRIQNSFHSTPQAQTCAPNKSAHISAHNAVQSLDQSAQAYVGALARIRNREALERAYEKACKRAKKQGRPEPERLGMKKKSGEDGEFGIFLFCCGWWRWL